MNYLERNLWKRINKKINGIAERVENLLSRGMPDVSISNTEMGDYWIELKVCKTKKIQGPKKLLSPIQKVWHKKRVKNGSKVYTLIGHESGNYLYKATIEKNSLQFEVRSLSEVFKNGMDNANS